MLSKESPLHSRTLRGRDRGNCHPFRVVWVRRKTPLLNWKNKKQLPDLMK